MRETVPPRPNPKGKFRDIEQLSGGRLGGCSWQEDWKAAVRQWTPGPFDLGSNTVAVFRVGSHSHGTHVPPEDPNGVDDIDLMVIVMPPPRHKLGLHHWDQSRIQIGNLDAVFYDWGKWLGMLRKQNPNVLGTLWLHPEDILVPNRPAAPELVELFRHRDTVISMNMHKAFVGYARGQLHKMTHGAWEGYMGAKRKALVEKFGFDTKNAAHLIRLLRMAVEALETGELVVRRADAAELIGIKHGAWSLERVNAEAARLIAEVGHALASSPLPKEPDHSFIDGLMTRGYLRWWSDRNLNL